jgi:hypothetical protein
MKKIKAFIMSIALLGTFFAPMLAASTTRVYAIDCSDLSKLTSDQALQCGACQNTTATDTANCTDDSSAATNKVNTILKLVINIFSLVVGVVAVIMIIIGGLRYILSGGDSGNITAAKNTILYAVVGLVIVALAQFIVRFVLAKVTGP